MGKVIEMVAEVLENDDWPVVCEEDEPTLHAPYAGESGGIWVLIVHEEEDLQQLLCYSVLVEDAPPGRIDEVIQFMSRANHGLGLGNFEIDLDGGEMRFKTSIATDGITLTPTAIYHLIASNVLTLDHYYGGLISVIEDGVSPEEAIANTEDRG